MSTIQVTDQNFEAEVLKSEKPVLVDFAAEWCGPCKMMSPIIDEIADELQGQLKVVKINVDEAQTLAAQYNVMSIPNLLIFKEGQVVDQLVGVMAKEQLLAKVNESLA